MVNLSPARITTLLPTSAHVSPRPAQIKTFLGVGIKFGIEK
jgi:hypothetical protein